MFPDHFETEQGNNNHDGRSSLIYRKQIIEKPQARDHSLSVALSSIIQDISTDMALDGANESNRRSTQLGIRTSVGAKLLATGVKTDGRPLGIGNI